MGENVLVRWNILIVKLISIDEEPNDKNIHIGQHIHAQFDLSMSIIDEINSNETSYICSKKQETRQ